MRYRDAAAAIDFICDVLGFEKRLIVTGPEETIAHAQLRLGGGMVMLGSATSAVDSENGKLIKQPAEDDAPHPLGIGS